MMQLQKHHALQILTLCAALTLSACGAGSSNSAAETPATATPAPTPATAAAPTPTAAECPFGDYQSAVVALGKMFPSEVNAPFMALSRLPLIIPEPIPTNAGYSEL